MRADVVRFVIVERKRHSVPSFQDMPGHMHTFRAGITDTTKTLSNMVGVSTIQRNTEGFSKAVVPMFQTDMVRTMGSKRPIVDADLRSPAAIPLTSQLIQLKLSDTKTNINH